MSRDTASSFKPGCLSKDLALMMYGFGDAETPYVESIVAVEQLLTQYARTLEARSFVITVKSQPKNYNRVMELLEMRDKLKKVRKIDYGLEE